MRADPDGPSHLAAPPRDAAIRIVIDRLITVEFFEVGDTEPQVQVTIDRTDSSEPVSPRA